MNRIVILGPPGAGKSTLARELGSLLGLPVVHLDHFFWKPGWVMRDIEEFASMERRALAGSSWVSDGNFPTTFSARLDRADTVVLLTPSRALCAWRIARRWWRFRGRTRPGMPEGCAERLQWRFAWWIWRFPRRRLAPLLALHAAHPDAPPLLRFRTAGEVNAWLATLS